MKLHPSEIPYKVQILKNINYWKIAKSNDIRLAL